MNKLTVLIVAFAAMYQIASAIPADPRPFKYTQPDGTVITLRLIGDEFNHWTVNVETGEEVVMDGDGYYRRVAGVYRSNRAPASVVRQLRREANEMRFAAAAKYLTHGTRKIPAVLVEFADVPFSLEDPQQKFNDLLNKQGYTDNGATGSVQDYYRDNSHGEFVPVFDVLPVVKLKHERSYYGKNYGGEPGSDQNPRAALIEACDELDGQVDFSQYDSDGDGKIDMMLMYFSGYNEAEHGPADSIWPHQSSAWGTYDGVRLGSYFCTSELKGSYGVNMCGIGTTAHEFGHSLGLPDFYDTNYGDNGSAHAMDDFSLMSGGSYLNGGRTPPYFNSEERKILHWLDDQIELTGSGPVTFESIEKNVGYRTDTDVDGEYFVYEARVRDHWDKYLPKGLLVYHVDKSRAHNVAGISCYEHWYDWQYYNDINCYLSHPMCYVIPAANQDSKNFGGNFNTDWLFGGLYKEYAPKSWSGDDSRYAFYDITIDGNVVRADFVDAIHGAGDTGLARLGQVYIANPGDGEYSVGDEFEFKLVYSNRLHPKDLRWIYDGTSVSQSQSSVKLTAGTHTVKASFSLSGSTEIIEMEINVK